MDDVISSPAAPSEAAIRRMVEQFYSRVRRDAMLGPVFARALGEDDAAWEAHFARLQDFWSSLMLRSGRYHGDPFSAHLRLPDIAPPMFDRWLALFRATCREVFAPEVADAFIERAERVARSLRMGLFERLPSTPARRAAGR
jgi:hemoglobin